MNFFSFIFLVTAGLSIAILAFLTQRHVSHVRKHRNTVPQEFAENIPLQAHQRAADYTQAKVRLGLYEYIIGIILLLVWTFGGGLQLLDNLWRSLQIPEILTGTGFIISCLLIASILDMPVNIYRIFGLEQRFGFNRTTLKLFITDTVKNALIALIIGVPMILLVLWIMSAAGSLWWFYVWLTWLGFSLLMMWAYPAFIAPIFNKFRPLKDETLRARIENLLTRNGFTSKGIYVMDGSSRSTHGNAYFTGLGANKRIVFFDTLISELQHEEIEAVLAHELGHFKCNHIKKRILVLGTVFFVGLAILGWLINKSWFYEGLGISAASNYMALILFVMVAPVFSFFLQPVFSYISRQHEFEADEFAADQAHTANLIQALVKLYRENANTLTPDPLYSAFHDSHPPAPIRINHLASQQT